MCVHVSFLAHRKITSLPKHSTAHGAPFLAGLFGRLIRCARSQLASVFVWQLKFRSAESVMSSALDRFPVEVINGCLDWRCVFLKRILQLFFAGNVLHLRPTVRAGTTPAASGVPRLVPDVDHETLSAGAPATVEPR